MSDSTNSVQLTANPLTDLGAIQQLFWQYLLIETPKPKQSRLHNHDHGSNRSQLEVDRKAHQHRQAGKQAELDAMKLCQDRFIAHFEKALAQRVSNPAMLRQHSPITELQVALLDELFSAKVNRNTLFNRLNALPDLSDALVRYVNRQQRQRDGAEVSNVRLAYNFLGVEQLQQILPWLQLQLWRPKGSNSLRHRKMLRLAQQQKRFAAQLAPKLNVSEGMAEGMAALQCLDIVLLLNMGELCFNQLKEGWLIQARQAGERIAHQAIFDLTLPSHSLLKQWQKPHQWSYHVLSPYLAPANKRLIAEMVQPDYNRLSATTKVVAQAHLMALNATLRRRRLATAEQLSVWQLSYPRLA